MSALDSDDLAIERYRRERVEALQAGATVLCDHYPKHTQVNVTVRVGPNDVAAYAVWLWPGVVRVAARRNGELLAQSRPGRPFELDAEATASEATR